MPNGINDGTGDKVGDALDELSQISPNQKVNTWMRIGAFFARLGQSFASKKR